MEDGTSKIADFGMAAGSGMTTATGTARGAGTRVYTAPEMLEHIFEDHGDDDDDDDDDDDSSNDDGGSSAKPPVAPPKAGVFKPACDVYALGLVMYAITTGKEPWEKLVAEYPDSAPLMVAKRVVQQDKHPPLKSSAGAEPFIELQLRRCWQRKPEDRPTAAELLKLFNSHEASYYAAGTEPPLLRFGLANYLREYCKLKPDQPRFQDELLKAVREVSPNLKSARS